MIWLWSNLWWLVPVAVLGAGLAHPVPRALLRRVPVRFWLGLGVVMLLGLTFQLGRWYERSVARETAEAKEVKADVKAAGVAEKANTEAREGSVVIRKESSDAAAEVRTIIRTVGDCPPLPARVHDRGRAAVEAARRELPAGPAGSP